MLKEKASWSKPVGIPGLIGRKRVDWSLFEGETHVPREFSEDFILANGGVDLSRGEARDLVLIVGGQRYAATLRKRTHVDAFQIRYDSNSGLKQLLRDRFCRSFEYLKSVRAQATTARLDSTVPTSQAEYIEFHETADPFTFRVTLVTSNGTEELSGFDKVWVDLGAIVGEGTSLTTLDGSGSIQGGWSDAGIEVETSRGSLTLPREAFAAAWGVLNAERIWAPYTVPDYESERANLVAAVLTLLPYVDYVAHKRLALFLITSTLSNNELSRLFEVGSQGGIRWSGSQESPGAVLFITEAPEAKDDSNPYHDRWEGDLFHYTGWGLEGDQTLTRGNKALESHLTRRFPIYGFKKLGPDRYAFMGRFKVEEVREERQIDTKGQSRKVFVFMMRNEADRQAIVQAEMTGYRLPDVGPSLGDIVRDFAQALEHCHIDYGSRHDELVRAFISALATKRFVILTGLSGSGKTQLALRFGQWLGVDKYLLEPVRPDWTGPEPLFGYEDALQKRSADGLPAWHVPPVLQFMLRAASDPMNPYLLILDEMNLAHVERYFADVLSGMESDQPCLPNLNQDQDGLWRAHPDREKIPFPRNLFVVGTVNVDETTYMFSPKVLDRANTFEFRVEPGDLRTDLQKPVTCEPGDARYVRGFLAIAIDDQWQVANPPRDLDVYADHLKNLHSLLYEGGFEFGHRVFYEAIRFLAMYQAAGGDDVEHALDLLLMQKVLPRLHGARRRLEPILCALGRFCFELVYDPGTVESGKATEFNPLGMNTAEARLRTSFDKVRRMTRSLRANQFTSFTEY